MCMYKAADGHCTYRSCAAVTEYCHDGPCDNEVLTNADHIRCMSDEELAAFLDKCEARGYCDNSIARNENGELLDMLEWLQLPWI